MFMKAPLSLCVGASIRSIIPVLAITYLITNKKDILKLMVSSLIMEILKYTWELICYTRNIIKDKNCKYNHVSLPSLILLDL